jgi:hypothetical protein
MAKPSPIRITDHALLRWLERAGLVDVEALRGAIAGALDRAYCAGAATGTSNFLILAHGMVYVVREDAVTTVVNDDGRHDRHAHLLDFTVGEASRD